MPKRRRMRDNERFSIIHDLSECYFCGAPATDKHEIFEGTANRQKSIQNGLVVGLCRNHHNAVHSSKSLALTLKRAGKIAFLKNHTEEEFLKIFGRTYETDL